EDGIRDYKVTGVQTCALPILHRDAALVLQDRAQRLAVDILHDDEQGAVVLVEVVNANDARVVEVGDRRGLALEAAAELGVLGVAVAQDLDRDRHLEAGMEALVDDSHRPPPELGLDREPTEVVDQARTIRRIPVTKFLTARFGIPFAPAWTPAFAYLWAAAVAASLKGLASFRSTFLSNFPTEVFGTSSMKRISSGS